MTSSCPPIDWVGFFAAMDGQKQQEFETDLAVRDISLGEYMEIVEQAAMEADARNPLPDCDRLDEEELLVIVGAMFSNYVNRKRLLTNHTWDFAGYREPSQSPAGRRLAPEENRDIVLTRRLQLRAAVHSRIKAIKSGRNKP